MRLFIVSIDWPGHLAATLTALVLNQGPDIFVMVNGTVVEDHNAAVTRKGIETGCLYRHHEDGKRQ